MAYKNRGLLDLSIQTIPLIPDLLQSFQVIYYFNAHVSNRLIGLNNAIIRALGHRYTNFA